MRRAMTSVPYETDQEETLAHRVRRDPNFCMLDETRPRLFVRGCFETCAVCLEEIVDAVTIAPCGHGTCAGCDAMLPKTDDRVCVMCKTTAPRKDYCTYELPPAMRARHASFEADMAKLGTIVAAPASRSSSSSASGATYGVGRGLEHGCTAMLVDIAADPAVYDDAVVVVLDASGSMATMDAWDSLVAQFESVARSMVGKHFAVIVFNDTARVVVPERLLCPEDVRAVVSELEKVKADGSTALHDALSLADRVADRMRSRVAAHVAVRIVLVTDGDATNKTEARRAMGEMRTPVFAVGFGSGYDYDLFAALCADVRGRGDSSTMFEHAKTVDRLVECMLEQRSAASFRLVVATHGHERAVVFFNGETRELGPDGVVEGSFVRSAGTRVAVVVYAQAQAQAQVVGLSVGGSSVCVEPSAELCTDVRRFVQATRAMEYVMHLSIRTPKHDVHTHTGLLCRTRAALRDIGPTMSGVIDVINERLSVMREERGCDSNTIARAASCAVRALTCGT
jgi:hypothetical protein